MGEILLAWVRVCCGVLLAAVLGASHALAQGTAWPTRPVRLIVTFAAGGTNDLLARLLAPELQRDFGQPFLVDNRAGAGGVIGTAAVAKAAPDGHTLLSTTNVYTINPALRSQLP